MDDCGLLKFYRDKTLFLPQILFLKIVDFYINDVRLSDEFYVVPGLSEDAILGVNTFQKWRIKLDFEHDTVIVDPKVAKAMLK